MAEEYDVDVEWLAFELVPGTPPEGTPRPFKEGETSELRGHMKDSAEAAGLSKMRRQQVTPYTIPAFEASEFAKEQDRFDDFHKAVFKAFWEEGRNIGVDDVLKEIFEECGMDWEEYESSGGGERYRPTVANQLMQARAYGISGVPAFILDRYLISGAQPYEVFQQVMQRIDQDRRKQGLWVPGQE